ncbi:uncharacterized protein LOC124118392 [Haliotis rufescens]|uniref:uncharacterized protein LOC124118392 n=1 Tax=Haliotis rufescens TaxID=6454 RepID=UPI00201F897E|nr:uncharacterized protein LOC124118392 [Haliotis rufescens]
MFVLYDSWNQRLMNCNAVALAIFFHDIVYDPKSPCNEQDSIQMFRAFALEAELNAHLIDTTIQLIDATITHLSNVADDNRDLKFFLDFDMAVLGRPADGYRDYAGQIQREYCHLDTETFNTKRAQVLQNFLTREHIFSTEEFKQLYEEQARTNIAREITLLQSQST